KKNNCLVTYKTENHPVFEFLERSDEVDSYECNIPLERAGTLLEGFDVDKKMLQLNYFSDFLVHYKNGDEKVLDVLNPKAAKSNKMMMLLDIARCYWRLKGKEWGIVTVGL
ncbi:MAG TPA: TnsA endonuclease N-terminal domain-containing protein, partial [Clostridia bacterium]|nr:TnsA endonuclease N-terminal domain-containing protein [Clostridia bacterium]